MMNSGERVVAIARGWIGTPYVHQASVKGAGTDCLGLLRGIWREIYGAEPEAVPPYTPDWSEPEGIERLWMAATRHMISVPACATVEPGQVLLFRMREGAVAKHLGIAAGSNQQPTFIHAFSGHRVVESPFSIPWARRVAARFLFP